MQASKAVLKAIARKARQAGYFKSATSSELYVYCPECHEKVEAQDFAYGTIKGVYKRRTTIQMLDAAMLAHLETYCGEE